MGAAGQTVEPSEKPVRSVRNKLTRDGAGLYKRPESSGGMAERLKAPVLKTGRRVTVSWVRIPLPPPCITCILPNTVDRREPPHCTERLQNSLYMSVSKPA